MYIIYYRTGPRDGSKPYTRNRVEETLVSYPQQTMLNKFKQSWPKMAFVCVLGIVVSYVICRGSNTHCDIGAAFIITYALRQTEP